MDTHDSTDHKCVQRRTRESEEFERRAQMLQAVHEVAADLGSELKLRPVLRRIMDRAVQLLDARRGGGIYLYDATENILRLTEVAGINEGRVGAIVQLHEGMSGHVFRTGQPLIVNDYANWPERLIVLVESPSSSVMGVPLGWAGKVIGVLGVFDDSARRTFDQADVELAKIFADQAAIAIHHAQLYEQTQQEIAERQRAEEALRQANDLLEARVAERTKELAAANARLTREVHERVEAENALKATEALSTSVLASLVAHLAIVDQTGTIIRVNEAWDRFARENGAGVGVGAFMGTNYLEVCRSAANRGARIAHTAVEGIQMVLAGQTREFVLEYPCHGPAADRWFLMRAVPMKSPEGGAVISHIDMTPWKRAEIEIARLRSDLAHAARVNSMGQLTASLAHELNQPLTAILSNAHAAERLLASGSQSSAEIREIFADIANDGKRAGEVIHRIRGLLKKEEFTSVPLVVQEIVDEVLALVRTDAIMRKTTIETESSPALPPVHGDRVQLQQVLLNLIMNGFEAMEKTPADDRRLVIRIRSKGAQEVLIGVQDAGVGIPADKLSSIFRPFFTSKPGGLGMGLAISRSIIEAHGGKIWPENNPRHGATLWFSLPVCP